MFPKDLLQHIDYPPFGVTLRILSKNNQLPGTDASQQHKPLLERQLSVIHLTFPGIKVPHQISFKDYSLLSGNGLYL